MVRVADGRGDRRWAPPCPPRPGAGRRNPPAWLGAGRGLSVLAGPRERTREGIPSRDRRLTRFTLTHSPRLRAAPRRVPVHNRPTERRARARDRVLTARPRPPGR